jgi:hypothetical protein
MPVSHEVRDGIVIARPLPLSMGESLRRPRSKEWPARRMRALAGAGLAKLEAGYRRLRQIGVLVFQCELGGRLGQPRCPGRSEQERLCGRFEKAEDRRFAGA